MQGLALYQDQLSHGLAQQAERIGQVEKLVKMKNIWERSDENII